VEPTLEPTPSGDATCARAWRAIRAYLAGSLGSRAEREMRVHLDRCDDCRERYHGAVLTLAGIGRARRRQRFTTERIERHERLRRLAFEAGEADPTRFHRLRSLLYPAFFAVLIFFVGRWSASPGVDVLALRGSVHASGSLLDSAEPIRLGRGDWCETAPDSAALLEVDGARIELGARGRLQVERSRPPRFRVGRGTLDVRGTCTLSTRFGVVDLDAARARVVVDDRRLLVERAGGSVVITGAAGAQAVEETAVVGAGGSEDEVP